MNKPAHYCWRCGKGVGPNQKTCYYCSAPVERHLRDPRQCPFCFGEIHPKALKCPHCGEFIGPDGAGAARPAAGHPAERDAEIRERLIFVIPPQLAPGNQPLFIPAGETVAEEFRRRLGRGTIQAIESGKPLLIDNPAVKALPYAEAQAQIPRALLPDGRPLPVVRGADGVIEVEAKNQRGGAVTLYDRTRRGFSGQALGGALVKAARAIGPLLNFRLPRGKITVSAASAADEEQPIRRCAQCETEILRTDNYCYHCGFSYVKKTATGGKLPRKLVDNTNLYAAIVLTLVLYGVLRHWGHVGIFVDALPLLPVVLAVVGILRRIALDSILWLIIALGLAIWILGGGSDSTALPRPAAIPTTTDQPLPADPSIISK